MKFQPDPYEKTVQIPVQIVNGQIVYFYGTPKPQFREGAIGDLILPAYAVYNAEALKKWQMEIPIELFSAKTRLYLGMSRQKIPEHLKEETINPPIVSHAGEYRLVAVTIHQPLTMTLRGTKPARLNRVKCTLDAMKTDASSLNQPILLPPPDMSHTVFRIPAICSTVFLSRG